MLGLPFSPQFETITYDHRQSGVRVMIMLTRVSNR